MSEYFLNTVLVVGGSLIGTLVLGSMAAYVLARFDFPGNRFVYYLFVGGMSFPVMLALVPLFYVVNNMGLLNTIHGLILVYIAYSLPFTVFFLTAFFRSLPTSVAEAAFVDGASHTRTFFQIMLPMARPGILSAGIYIFVMLWKEFELALVFISEESKQTISLGLYSLVTKLTYTGDWGGLFAGVVLVIVPSVVFYVCLARHFTSGLTAGIGKD